MKAHVDQVLFVFTLAVATTAVKSESTECTEIYGASNDYHCSCPLNTFAYCKPFSPPPSPMPSLSPVRLTKLFLFYSGRTALNRIHLQNVTFSNGYIDADIIAGVRHLEILSFENCNISSVRAHTFTNFPNLKRLVMQKNGVITISSNAFFGTTLNQLSLYYNKGLHLHRESFRQASVVNMYLQNSNMATIDFSVFDYLTNSLRRLRLGDNRLTKIDQSSQTVLDRLDHIDLTNNPMDCGCNVRWLHYYALRRPSIFKEYGLPKCNSPASERNKAIDKVLVAKLSCDLAYVSEISVTVTPTHVTFGCGAPKSGSSRTRITDINDNSLSTAALRKPVIRKFYRQSVNTFLCDVENDAGSTQTNVSIDLTHFVLNRRAAETSDVTHVITAPTARSPPDVVSYDSGPAATPVPYADISVWHAKRFTAVDLIGTVLGTFFGALLLFALLCLVAQRWCGDRRSPRKPNPYDATCSSGSQVYDVPRTSLMEAPAAFGSMPPPPPRPPSQHLNYNNGYAGHYTLPRFDHNPSHQGGLGPIATSQHGNFVDFKTHGVRPLLYGPSQ